MSREAVIIKAIDGHSLAQMMISGAHKLYNNRQLVNDLNVFPVPDGDTGTNMSMTVMAMAKMLEESVSPSISKTADTMAYSTLRGARGNSGVILSQLFRGISKSLKGMNECSAADFAKALSDGVDTAYRAVMNPTEGTILTVSREAAMRAVVEASKDADITAVLEGAVTRGNRVLAQTQDMLPALKQAGVVDAGGQGWMLLLEGALEYLKTGAEVELLEKPFEAFAGHKPKTAAAQNIRFMYCTEFIVQKKNAGVGVDAFRSTIAQKGDSMLVIDDDDIIKVHIHTNNPGFVLERAVKLGMMTNIKIDNMKFQHNNMIEQQGQQENKAYGFVSVSAGEGLAAISRDLGIDKIIEGGQTMNPSTDDILSAVNDVNADTVFVFPNNSNIFLAANQASEMSDRQVIVIPTKNIAQCFSAMLNFSETVAPEENEAAMNEAMEKIEVGQVTYAVRDSSADGKEINAGDYLGMLGKNIAAVEKDCEGAAMALVDGMMDEDKEFITLYYGSDVSEEQADALAQSIEEKYDEVEVSVKNGGQPLYFYIISME